MSEWPSSLKSPVPIAFQAVPGLGLTGPPPIKVLPFISQIETWPRRRVLKKDVGMAVVVEIARSDRFPSSARDWGSPARRRSSVFPFISQIETWPVLVFCHRMSARPSPLKSPVPIAFQLGPGLGLTGPPPIGVFPFMSQIEA